MKPLKSSEQASDMTRIETRSVIAHEVDWLAVTLGFAEFDAGTSMM
jgi:hypothetical protein